MVCFKNPMKPISGQLNIQFECCGQEESRPGKVWGPGIPNQYKIIYINKGRGQVTVRGKTYRLTRGQGFVLFPNLIYMYKADETDPWTLSWLAFKGMQAESYFIRAGISPDQPVFNADGPCWFEDMFEQLRTAHDSGNTQDILIQSILYRAIAELVKIGEANAPLCLTKRPKDAYVRKAVSYIEMNLSRKISIEELADHVGIDRKYLSALFKEMVQLSPQIYILHLRMNKACTLLQNGILTITDVARFVGYEDPLLFSKMFKRVTGQSPKAYRAATIC